MLTESSSNVGLRLIFSKHIQYDLLLVGQRSQFFPCIFYPINVQLLLTLHSCNARNMPYQRRGPRREANLRTGLMIFAF
jgi:hypothetical protein